VDIDPELQRLLDGVTGLRPRRVLDHILEHGYITTAELTSEYGYNHPPPAARDVREHCIPLVTYRVTGPDGRSIGAYRLGDPKDISEGKSGRRAFPKSFKDELVARQGERCALCGWRFPARALQIDHRVPFEVGGDYAPLTDFDAYMLVCGSCNRSKSWSCEHCPNWTDDKDVATCQSCLWGSPEDYEHVATEQRRSLKLAWQGAAIADYERLRDAASEARVPIAEFARELLRRVL
jgi:hypothetical protein